MTMHFFYVKTTLINFGNVCAENTPHQHKFQQLIKQQQHNNLFQHPVCTRTINLIQQNEQRFTAQQSIEIGIFQDVVFYNRTTEGIAGWLKCLNQFLHLQAASSKCPQPLSLSEPRKLIITRHPWSRSGITPQSKDNLKNDKQQQWEYALAITLVGKWSLIIWNQS